MVHLSQDARERLARAERPPFAWRHFARSFWVSPRRYPDFAWAWTTRFAVHLGNSMAILYLPYFLRDKIHYSRLFPGQTAEDGLLILIVAYTIGVLLSAVAGGMASDRSGRRKPLVTVSGLLMAVPAVMLAIWPTWPVTVSCAVLLGLGFGAYLSVDLALVTQVLPSEAGYAKDLGIINIAGSGPQVLAPAIAAPIVSSLGGYPALYLSVAVLPLRMRAARKGSTRALRAVTIMAVAIFAVNVVEAALPHAFPGWMRIEMVVIAVLMALLVGLVTGRVHR